MPSDSQLLAEILAELKALNLAMKSQTGTRQVSPGAPGGASDPIVPFGYSKGKRVSECSQKDWEFLAAMPLRAKKDGGFWPPDLQNAALAMLGRPPLSTTPAAAQEDAGDDWQPPKKTEEAAQDPADLDCPF